MDTFVDSSWYFVRYCSRKDEDPLDKTNIGHWMPVDQYIGGIEHAVFTFLYSRFFTRCMKDLASSASANFCQSAHPRDGLQRNAQMP